jgi:hypothetical protein
MTIQEMVAKLNAIEDFKTKGIRDNMRINLLHLVIYGDGSGLVQADWSKYRNDMCKEERLLHQIFSTEGPLFEFTRIEELEEWLTKEAP